MTTKLMMDPVKQIQKLFDEVRVSVKMSLEKAIELGGALTEQKEALGHGKFLPWVEKNLPFSERTARNYIKVYVWREDPKLIAVTNLTQAYKLLAPKPEKRTPKSPSGEEVASEPESRTKGSNTKSNASLGTHLNPVTPRNDSEEEGKPEIVTVGETVMTKK